MDYISSGRQDFLLQIRRVILSISALPALADPDASRIFLDDIYTVRRATSSLSAALAEFEHSMDVLWSKWMEAPEMPEAFFDLCRHFHSEVEHFTAAYN